ncbi:tyrosine recombinase XerC [Amycolatopsis sp. NPDC059657]|uniref:site-specific integrase n=1 Tax=Amycolatopsis sp. NPDC059657 TaxID=3346899 RepID=UPI00366E51C5
MAGRNANGEGTIYRRKDGRYEAAIFAQTTSSKRKRVRIYGKTRREVHEKLAELKGKTQQGIPIPDREWKLGAYLDYWLENEVAKARPLTHVRYESVVRLHLKPHIGQLRLTQLTVPMLQTFFDQQAVDATSPSTLHNMRKVLSAALTSAQRLEIVFRNVARLIKLPRYKAKENTPWTVDESRSFLQAVKTHRLYPAYLLCILYGFRCGELLGLRWTDVDFSERLIHVRQQLQRVRNRLQTADLKTDAGRRDEPLVSLAAEALSAHFQAAKGAELVFTTKLGTPIEPRNFLRDFQAICDRIGSRRIKVHDLRDTSGTMLKDLKVPDRDIQVILGHSNVNTTRRYYQHVSLDNQRDALEKVERLFIRTAVVTRCRQTLPSNQANVDQIASLISGAPGWTRTNDLRLRRSAFDPFVNRFQSIKEAVSERSRQWILGCVAVSAAVKESK